MLSVFKVVSSSVLLLLLLWMALVGVLSGSAGAGGGGGAATSLPPADLAGPRFPGLYEAALQSLAMWPVFSQVRQNGPALNHVV